MHILGRNIEAMIERMQDETVFSLILVPIKSGLRGFYLFIFVLGLSDYRQNKPLEYNSILLVMF